MRRSRRGVGCPPRANGHGLRPASRWTGTGDQRQRPIGGSRRAGTDLCAPWADIVRDRPRTSRSDAHSRRGELPVAALPHRGWQQLDYSADSASCLTPIAVVGGAATTLDRLPPAPAEKPPVAAAAPAAGAAPATEPARPDVKPAAAPPAPNAAASAEPPAPAPAPPVQSGSAFQWPVRG